jgi:hypothetical protein
VPPSSAPPAALAHQSERPRKPPLTSVASRSPCGGTAATPGAQPSQLGDAMDQPTPHPSTADHRTEPSVSGQFKLPTGGQLAGRYLAALPLPRVMRLCSC